MESVRDIGSKLFIGGLSWGVSEDALEKYFEQFGDILEVVVIRDRNTSKPRGFGFVTFKDEDALAAVMAHEGHTIDGKEISVKRSHQKESQSISAKKLIICRRNAKYCDTGGHARVLFNVWAGGRNTSHV